MSTAVIVHDWGDDSESCWIPWLEDELKKRGMEVVAHDMPDTTTPRMEAWVPFLSSLVRDVNEGVYFVGHSIGCQTILRYLATLESEKRAGGVVFVAGWTSLSGLDDKEKEIARPWLETPIDWKGVSSHSKAFVCIYSDDDPVVPIENAQVFAEKLGAKLILDSNRGHFSDDDDVTELPVLLRELLLLMNVPYEERLI